MAQLQRRHLGGIFLTSMSSLTLEVVLTRIFSVTMWYHFAFLAISLALLGNAVAGVLLYFFPRLRQPERARRWLGWLALALSVAVPLTFLLYRCIPFQIEVARAGSGWGMQTLWLALVIVDLMLPFLLVGAILALALSTWPDQAARIYGADLSGAASGCLFSILALEVGGGIGAVLIVGALGALAALALNWEARGRAALAAMLALDLAGFTVANHHQGWLTISANGGKEAPRVYERWNAYSRVSVYETVYYPFFWSVDSRYWDKTIQEGRFLNHALLLIDAVAGTPIQEFRGLLHEVEFLRYDLSSFVYHVTDSPSTLVIGPGGGRDVLAALASGAPHVTAVEVNPAVIAAVRGPFADFSGHLYDRPDVTLAINDARGYIARSSERYDVIQASLIDTWAAGASGAFALSENSLYTKEAFETYYAHLTDRGILSISRWYLQERPAETLRLVSTGMAGWSRAGVADPRQHIVVVARPEPTGAAEGMSTTLFKRTPFTAEEIALIKAKAAELGFTVLYVPGLPPHEEVSRFITAEDQAAVVAAYPLDISPATDDRPFFFNLFRFGDLFDASLNRSGVSHNSMEAIRILGIVIGVTIGLSVLLILVPLWAGGWRRGLERPQGRLLAYFGLLGVGFMLVEMPLIQRLTVYLGRPVYSLAIVLFSILLFSSLGSLWTGRWSAAQLSSRSRWLFPVLVILILVQSLAGAWFLEATMAWSFTIRMMMTVLILAPLGLLMGMPFPLGVRWAGSRQPGAVPWLWGTNGVTSVLSSALAIALAIHVGFRFTLGIAAALYALAGFLIYRELHRASVP